MITGIEIPLVQRDYAQGRPGPQVEEIRTTFLAVLHDAVTGGEPVGLDFVYGDIIDGALLPLDGQQRLTTLFLLHWYLCFRTGRLPTDQDWHRFSYDTRQSARMFCERLVKNPPPANEPKPTAWIINQHWYLHLWRNDPTIASMLTMISAIDERLVSDDLHAAWDRLTDATRPAITFHLLPIEEVGPGDELYIKMNSRGKPLTPFENFKARFGKTLAWSERSMEFAHKVDGAWSDLLWHLRGDDNLIDDEFLRYFTFIVEICEWREDLFATGDLHHRTQALFVPDNERAQQHINFLFDAFKVWQDESDITSTFTGLFSTAHMPAGNGVPSSVVLFGSGKVATNLFRACCEKYGEARGPGRIFSLGQSLLLYAVLLHRIHGTTDFSRRIRIVRNLIEASINELRPDNMPKLLRDVERIVVDGTLDGVSTFNQIQVADERIKMDFFATHPELLPAAHRLEDHNLLRGSLAAFELVPEGFTERAEAFVGLFSDHENWPALTGALLAAGPYERRRPNSAGYQFGTGSAANGGVWLSLFTGARDDLTRTRAALRDLLDGFVSTHAAAPIHLVEVSSAWCERREESHHLDWRYYLVRYDCMRTGATGIYFGVDGVLGYSLCMLRKTQLNSYYRDPFLYAVHLTSEVDDAVRDAWFRGYPDDERWLRLDASGTGMRSVAQGLVLDPPKLPEHQPLFDEVCKADTSITEVDDVYRVVIAQEDHDGVLIDIEDRVVRGATVLNALAAAGL